MIRTLSQRHVWLVGTLAPKVWPRNDTDHLCSHFLGQVGHRVSKVGPRTSVVLLWQETEVGGAKTEHHSWVGS